jgi:hypothetical protein
MKERARMSAVIHPAVPPPMSTMRRRPAGAGPAGGELGGLYE